MAQQRHVVPIISTFFISFVSFCFCLPDQDPPYNYLEEAANGFDSGAYPSYFSAIEDGKSKDDMIKLRTHVLSVKNVGVSSFTTLSVDDFGDKGDGTDDTQAFMKAWKQACSSPGAVLVVPEEKTYRVKQIRFSGPCKANLTVQISGTIEASHDQSDYEKDGRHWLIFDNVQNLVVTGGGTINGSGKMWWQNSCKVNKSLPCKGAPTALTFFENKNLMVKNLNIQDAQQIHVSFQNCINVWASNLVVTAPEQSPNTDGIHVTHTQNIQITSSTIGTGDDCISIVSGSQNVQVQDITCGPGHGFSIGSLGAGNKEAHVSRVTVNGAKLSGTTNGVRIKTWQSNSFCPSILTYAGRSGNASNIKFQNIDMLNVTNPIIVNQNYCDQDEPCKEQSSAVQVKNVVYQNIKGTSASKVAVKFDCSKTHPCQGIVLQNIKLEVEADGREETVEATCNNIQVFQIGVVTPRCP